MVPISLYVSIELVKLFQVYFIQEDIGKPRPSAQPAAASRPARHCSH